MQRTLFRTALAVCITLANTDLASAAPTEKDRKLLAEVAGKLLAVCDKPPGLEWDKIDIGFMQEKGKGVNAEVSVTEKDGKRYPVIRVGENLMAKVVWGEKIGEEVGAEDRLAFVVGHELGHLVKDHLSKSPGDKTPTVALAFKRDQEIEADRYGLELVVKAGFDFDRAIHGITRIKDALKDAGLDYSSIEGPGKDHPSWDDRRAKADKDRAHLWKVVAAFENGVTFLSVEDYDTAINCFDKVTRQFPGAYEAWANLGYARLMKYCDKWSKKDLELQGIGHVVAGGFYTRLHSPIIREKDKKLWFDAVGALNEANRLKPKQTVVLANLGLAYLLGPDGKEVGDSTRFFAEAAAAAKEDKHLDPVAHASLFVNLGINTMAVGDTDKALTQLDEGEKAVRTLAITAKRPARKFDPSLLYARALILAAKPGKADKQEAHDLLEKYLHLCSLRSLWWDVGYDKYAEVCKVIGKEPKPKDAFKKDRTEPTRLVTGIKVKVNGKEQTITLGDDILDVEKALGKGVVTTAAHGTTLVRVRYEQLGIELLAGDRVVAITLSGPDAPAIPLVGKMTGTGKVGELKIGMTAAQVVALLGDISEHCEIATPGVFHDFYREQGVAVRIDKPHDPNGKVIALVVVQIPK